VTCNHMLDVVNKRLEEVEDEDAHETLWFLENIVGHRLNHDERKCSVKVRWSTKEETWEPLDIIAVDDPVACAKHAKENDSLELPGWKRFKRLAAREKKFMRMLRQAHASKKKNATKHMFGARMPRNCQEALAFDKANGNAFWEDAAKKEMDQIKACNTFKDIGKGARVLRSGYQKVHVHLMHANKFDMRRKARSALSGQLTPPSDDKAHSGIVSLEGARTVLFLAELNELQLCAADIAQACLEANTREKLAIVGGPEFGELSGHTRILMKALHGARTSGNRFAEKLADDLLNLGFFQCQHDPAIWMRDCGDHCEHLCTWVDDLLFASKNPMWLMKALQDEPHGCTLKGVGFPSCCLGADIKRVDKDVVDKGVLTMGSTAHVKRSLENCERIVGLKPPEKVSQPVHPDCHPELDTADIMDSDGRQIYWSSIGMPQWAATLGRIDIHHATMCMSGFRAEPRQGHLQAVAKMFGCLDDCRSASIKFRTGIPDHSEIEKEQPVEFDWSHIHGKVKEMTDPNLPKAKRQICESIILYRCEPGS